jgi:hypothetical protein
MKRRETQAFRVWRGHAFEQVCLSHISQIQRAIGVVGVITQVECWRSSQSGPGAQIDLLINRNDGVVSLCEMKFSDSEVAVTKTLAKNIRNKRNAFVEETRTKKAIHITLVTPIGLKRNVYYDLIQSLVTADDLFSDR